MMLRGLPFFRAGGAPAANAEEASALPRNVRRL